MAQAASEIAYRPIGSRSGVAASYGSLPSAQSESSTFELPGAASASGRSSVGTIIAGSRSGATTSIVSRSVIAVGAYPVR